jgi:hypothetical protein
VANVKDANYLRYNVYRIIRLICPVLAAVKQKANFETHGLRFRHDRVAGRHFPEVAEEGFEAVRPFFGDLEAPASLYVNCDRNKLI